jgi:hypothetical protein
MSTTMRTNHLSVAVVTPEEREIFSPLLSATSSSSSARLKETDYYSHSVDDESSKYDDGVAEDDITIKRSHSGENRNSSGSAAAAATSAQHYYLRRRSSSGGEDEDLATTNQSPKSNPLSSTMSDSSNSDYQRQQQYHIEQQQQQQQQQNVYQYQLWQYHQQYHAAYAAQQQQQASIQQHPPYYFAVPQQVSPTNYSYPDYPSLQHAGSLPQHDLQPNNPLSYGLPSKPVTTTSSSSSSSHKRPRHRNTATSPNESPKMPHKTLPATTTQDTKSKASHFTFETESSSGNGGGSDVYASLLQQGPSGGGYGTVKPSAPPPVPPPSSGVSRSASHPPPVVSHIGNSAAAPKSNIAAIASTTTSSGRLPPSRANSIGASTKATAWDNAGTSNSPPRRGSAGSTIGGGGGGSAHRRAISDGDRFRIASRQKGNQPQLLPKTDPSTRRPSLNQQHGIGSHRWRANSESHSPKIGRPPTASSPSGSIAGGGGSVGGGGGGGHHRRSSSIASVGALSYMSEASMTSIVSNIRKSVFFDGVHERTGKAKLCFPLSKVHLIPLATLDATSPNMVDRTTNGSNAIESAPSPHGGSCISVSTLDGYPLQLGRLYKVPIAENEFEQYHRVAQDFDLDSDDLNIDVWDDAKCRCDCAHCVSGCVYRQDGGVLPTNYFCLTIADDIYRRLLDDISDSQQMPCGLFFCGHHEDVSRPSIVIAVSVLVLVFVTMGLLALWF